MAGRFDNLKHRDLGGIQAAVFIAPDKGTKNRASEESERP